ncbi:ABC transporter permease [Halomicrococcus sp. SG-WS-1]|uniref:ABC transporter permease n=1 Tax=Halomicrococcus sp. SG-WS-1 TaxID=3439057 RepID=UPI003F7B3587
MSWAVVARKDFEDAARSKMLWAITVLFVLTTAGGMYAYDAMNTNPSAADAINWLGTPASLIIPLAALVVAYLAIAGERESGSIKLLLGLPHTRGDVVFGKLVGRSVVVGVATVVAFVAGAAVLLLNYGTVPVVDFAVLGVLTLLFATAFVGIAIGFSSLAATRSRAMAGAIGLFFVFQLIWDFVPLGVFYVVEGGLPTGELPPWFFLVQVLNPKNAYSTLSTLLINENATTQFEAVLGEVPFYLDTWFLFVILLAWLVVPVALGYLRFRSVDLS